MNFPILFKICLSDNDNSKYRALGYKNVHKFFRGQSVKKSLSKLEIKEKKSKSLMAMT